MPKFGLILILFLLAGCAYGQQEYFVLIQSENNQPFYVRMGEKTLSSTPQGHVIIPQMKDSVYSMTIGFPKKLFPEQDFFLIVDHRDMEFELRNVEGKGWGLFNPENQQFLMPTEKDTVGSRLPPMGTKKDDAFSRMMAWVVNDTAVMYNTHALDSLLEDNGHTVRDSTQTVRDSAHTVQRSAHTFRDSSRTTKDSVHPVPAVTPLVAPPNSAAINGPPPTDSTRTARTILKYSVHDTAGDSLHGLRDSGRAPGDTAHIDKIPVAPGPGSAKKPRKPETIAKLSEQRTATGLSQSYTDHTKGHKTDTIQVLIAVDSTTHVLHNQQDTSKNGSGPYTGAAGTPGGGKDSVSNGKDAAVEKIATKHPVVINSDCRNFATDGDLDKLKAKMMAAATDEARMIAAGKVFKLKCFSTSQLRSLSGVFAQEPARYDFLEKAYPFVSDDGFRGLLDLFADPVYIGKFKTLAGIGN